MAGVSKIIVVSTIELLTCKVKMNINDTIISWQPRIYAIVHNAAWVHKNDVDDVAQALSMRLFLVLSKKAWDVAHPSGATLNTYIYICLRQELRSQWHAKQTRKRSMNSTMHQLDTTRNDGDPLCHDNGFSNIDAREAALSMLGRLPLAQAEAFTLMALGYEMKEAAALCGVSYPTIGRRAQQAVERLHGQGADAVLEGAFAGPAFDYLAAERRLRAPHVVRQNASVRMWLQNRKVLRRKIKAQLAARRAAKVTT